MKKRIDWSKYEVRTCLTMHECAVCHGTIEARHEYRDGGYGRRAHETCVQAIMEKARSTAIDACVIAIWDDMCNRSGIGDVLDELDDETRLEILESWKGHITAALGKGEK